MKRYASLRYARLYDRLRVYDGGTRTALDIIDGLRGLRGATVVELGAGTGALTVHLAKRARRVQAFDASKLMIAVAREKVGRSGLSNCCLAVADHRRIPLSDASADVVVAAWTLASLVYASPAETWSEALDDVVHEMKRLLRRRGIAAVLCPADSGQRDYIARLEANHGFNCVPFDSRWRFPTIATARAVIQFFLGEATWKAYRRRWPEDLVTQCGVWWTLGEAVDRV